MTKRLVRSLFCALIVVWADCPATAATEIVRPAAERFAGRHGADVPDFQRHVVPLLGRLRCNGRACHGSFQGRGGFRLSLFGFNFKQDLQALKDEASSEHQPRLSVQSPNQSLIVRKPSLQIEHEGGRRLQTGSWEHHTLVRWIAAGARGAETVQQLERLEVQPSELVFAAEGAEAQLRVVAVWADGSREDVTCLCRFRTNDSSVALVDADGRVTARDSGDTHVVAFYDNGVAALPVLRPRGPVARKLDCSKQPNTGPANRVDQLVLAKLEKLGIAPADLCTDAQFLRRVSIDMTGTLPTPAEVESFLADSSADKRQRKVDELLERPAYAAWWANKLCDFTGCNPIQQAEVGQELAVQWYDWIYQRLRANMPYDELVAGIVLAVGRGPGESYDEYTSEVSAYFREAAPADFAERPTMPHYWTRTTLDKPEDRALAFAHSFLGIRLQCAQCHKHPYDQWTQQDFQQFSRFFADLRFGVRPDARNRYRQLAKQVGLRVRGDEGSPVRAGVLAKARAGAVVPWRELYVTPRERPLELRLLRSRLVQLSTADDPRQPIMDWMRDPDNPWFARALVNRVWASYFHAGIVDPPDDLNSAKPPSNPALLDWLARGFIEQDYDFKWLHRQLANSATYQRSWRPNQTNRGDRRNFSRAIPRRLPAEVVYDAVKQATAASDQLDRVRNDLSRRAAGHLSMRMAGTYAMNVFGKPDRAMNCDCERVNEPSLLQSVFLKNDPLVRLRLQESGWLEEIRQAERPDCAQLIRTAWLRTLGRPPKQPEFDRAQRYLDETPSVADGLSDLLWALLNTKEFVLNH